MKIKNKPPMFQWIVKLFFPGYDFNRVVGFAFGDTIYTRFNPLPDYNLIHEKTHLKQMKFSRFYGIIHFIRFILSKKFRYKTELEAYRNEYFFIKAKYPGNEWRAAQKFAEVLSGQGENAYVYGRLVDYQKALNDIIYE